MENEKIKKAIESTKSAIKTNLPKATKEFLEGRKFKKRTRIDVKKETKLKKGTFYDL